MKRTRLRSVSKKRAKENTTYALAKAEWIAKQVGKEGYWRCEWKGNPILAADDNLRCLSPANDLHHRRKRGKYLSHKQFFMGLCREHHRWLHDHGKEARKRGYLSD